MSLITVSKTSHTKKRIHRALLLPALLVLSIRNANMIS
jgi:hypothetical protein